MRSSEDYYIDVEQVCIDIKQQEFRLDSTPYHPGLFEWTHFRSRTEDGGLYLLLLVDKILNNIKLGSNYVKFQSHLKEAKAG